MGARGSIAGLFLVVAASLALAADGLGAPAAVAPVAATPSPAATISAAPVPAASIAPIAAPTLPAVLRALIPLAGASAAPLQAYATFMRGAEHQDGVIDLVRKDDQLYLDLRPENFGKPYIILPSITSGVGGEAFAGRVYDPLVVIFKRVGRRVMWVTPNTRYVADKGTSAAASLAVSVADSVIQATPVVAEDTAKTHVVIEPTFFLSDFEGIGADLGKGVTAPSLPGLLLISVRPSFGVDATKSYYLSTKSFPLNDEISVNLTFNGPANALPTVPDGRGIPLVVHYSIVAPPAHDPNYVPRYADDRIGYFITARKHFGNDVSTLPTERFIDRWNLDAGPIVFTLTKEIPPTYRDTVRRGILAWNAAFAKVGYPHAIVVNDPPADPQFDPEDARYNSVRWITSDAPDFVALSPHISDPDTGQIIRTEVVVDGESMRSVRRGYVDRVLPLRIQRNAFLAMAQLEPVAASDDVNGVQDALTCDDAAVESNQAALGMSMLVGQRHGTVREREAYAQAFLYSTVMHEVGHTLGLRHNFAGSTAFTYAELHDPAFTRAHGTTGSVMDYTPANIAAPGERQADYFPNRLGPYDYWAIEYGYARLHQPTSNAELPALHKIAARSTQPGLAYGTDEDVIAPYAIDPNIQRFNLSSDPLAFARAQFRIDDDLSARLTHHYPGDTRTYQDLRQTLISVLNNDLANISIASRYIGGVYTSRSHRGQPGGAPPFAAIPRAEQRRAFDLIDKYVLSSQALQYSPQLLNDVAPIRYGADWSTGGIRRTDFPIREVVAELQDAAIAALFNPASISRIANESLKESHPGQTMDLADLFTWTNNAIFDDLGSHTIAAPHRDLQRRFADLELQIAFLGSGSMDQLGIPREIQALSRYELRQVRGRLDNAYKAATDIATRAHLDDLRSRIDTGLRPGALRPI